MMSIMIKNLEMPTCCWDCPIQVNPFCAANDVIDLEERTKRPDKCPLTGVPEDVRPVEHGEWTAEGNDEIGNYWDECTACRKAVWFPPSVKNDYKYCPHCGAKMDGAE